MKKIYLVLLVVLSFGIVQAQSAFRQTTSNPTGSIFNTGSDTMNIALTKGYSSVSIQPYITKDSGTMAGKAYLYYSVNGTNFTLRDSVSLQNSTEQWTIWQVVDKPARYFRIIVGGATTVGGKATAKLQTN